MRRTFLILLLCFLALLSACAETQSKPTDPPVITSSPEATPGATVPDPGEETPEPSVELSVEPTENPAPETDEKWREIFRDFIEENYTELTKACVGGMAGAGFVDLDADGTPELLIFDFGASAATGVQIFDIVSGKVECISANMHAVGERFGGIHYQPLYVTVGHFEDFRLVEDRTGGNLYFYVTSGNAAEDFSYKEIIVFGNNGSALTITSRFYEYFEYAESGDDDEESGGEREIILQHFEMSGVPLSREDYDKELLAFQRQQRDTGYRGSGTFIWSKASYYRGLEGFLELVDNAMEKYKAPDSDL